MVATISSILPTRMNGKFNYMKQLFNYPLQTPEKKRIPLDR